jgi:hypothetical protein
MKQNYVVTLHMTLLGSLLNCLHTNFRDCGSPEDYLERADGKKCQSTEIIGRRVVLIGASNLGHRVPHFAAPNMEFTSVIKPGWIATGKNVADWLRESRNQLWKQLPLCLTCLVTAQSVSSNLTEPHHCRFIATGNIT